MNVDERIRQVVRTIGEAAPPPPALKTPVQLPERRRWSSGPAVGLATFLAVVALFVIGELVLGNREVPPSDVASVTSPPVSTGTAPAPALADSIHGEDDLGDSQDFRDDLDSLRAAVEAYVACMEPDLDGYIRVRFDRFVGYTGEVHLPDGRDDSELMKSLSISCEISSGLPDESTAFQVNHPPTRVQLRAIVADVTKCLEAAGMDYAEYFSQLEPRDFSALNVSIGEITFPSDVSEAEAVMACVDEAVYGVKTEH